MPGSHQEEATKSLQRITAVGSYLPREKGWKAAGGGAAEGASARGSRAGGLVTSATRLEKG